MRYTFFILLFAFTATHSFAQSANFYVTGKVLNADTKTPLQAASVFAENTTLGTTTDAEGNFRLLLPNGGYTLVVTFTGFNTESKRINLSDGNDKDNLFELKPKEKEMQAVAIVASNEVNSIPIFSKAKSYQ